MGVGRYCPLTRICGEPLRLDGAGTATLNGLTALRNCPLTRIGTQLLRCDNLTGAGARAPWWVPEY